MSDKNRKIEYAVMNPSQNITILVTTEVAESEYATIAKELLNLEPSAEQVGFIKFNGFNRQLNLKKSKCDFLGDDIKIENESVVYSDEKKCDIVLNMAGGEFCGNATMSTAVYYSIKNNITCKSQNVDFTEAQKKVVVKSSGVDELISVDIKKFDDEWEGIVEMPRPFKIQEVDFGAGDNFPVVFFKGIAHVIIDKKLIDKKKNDIIISKDSYNNYYENKIKKWCNILNVKALGILLCDFGNMINMIPLVYVKSIDTLYLESSCASGTTAIGAYLKDKTKKEININIKQPSGVELNIESKNDNKLLLRGKVVLLYEKTLII